MTGAEGARNKIHRVGEKSGELLELTLSLQIEKRVRREEGDGRDERSYSSIEAEEQAKPIGNDEGNQRAENEGTYGPVEAGFDNEFAEPGRRCEIPEEAIEPGDRAVGVVTEDVDLLRGVGVGAPCNVVQTGVCELLRPRGLSEHHNHCEDNDEDENKQ